MVVSKWYDHMLNHYNTTDSVNASHFPCILLFRLHSAAPMSRASFLQLSGTTELIYAMVKMSRFRALYSDSLETWQYKPYVLLYLWEEWLKSCGCNFYHHPCLLPFMLVAQCLRYWGCKKAAHYTESLTQKHNKVVSYEAEANTYSEKPI